MTDIRDSSNPAQATQILWQLRKDKLRNAVILKYYLALPAHTKIMQVVEGAATATLLLLNPHASTYDRETYPEAGVIAFIVSDHPTLTAALRPFVPRDQQLIFKLTEERDARMVAEDFVLDRATSYLTFSTRTAFNPDPAVSIAHTADHLPFDLFAKQGHDANWLRAMIARQQAIASVYREDETAVSACIAFQLDDGIWEVGGVYTQPHQRGKGYGRRVVTTALAHLYQHGQIPRYQVNESNIASIRLAESLGMECCQTLTHYRAEPFSQTTHP
jgi:RimJ/RimL family protein N-acetyltransferase